MGAAQGRAAAVQGGGRRLRRRRGRGHGTTFFRVPPGASAVPYHAHHANEEAAYVLQGRGTLRMGGRSRRRPLRRLDRLPPRRPARAPALHQQGGGARLPLHEHHERGRRHRLPGLQKKLLAVAGAAAGGIRSMFRSADGGVDYFEGGAIGSSRSAASPRRRSRRSRRSRGASRLREPATRRLYLTMQ